VTFPGLLTFEKSLWTLLLAVALSLLSLAWRTSQGRMSELGLGRGKLGFEEVGAASEVRPISGLLIFALEESLFFATADTVRVGITNRLAAAASVGT
jgi:MFS superfamily sulfate permease-like transporter